MNRRTKQRMSRDAVYNAASDIYKEENPRCNYCGNSFSPSSLHVDHIVAGTAGRAASLLHFDTWNTTCATCHELNPERAVKAAAKVVNALQTIERLQGRNFDFREDCLIWKAVVNREPGYVR